MNEQDVIVVGGGLAGLAAARDLHHVGRQVLVLEATDRMGGRAYTGQLDGVDVELGGAFVHWFQAHLFAELTRYGIPYRPVPLPTRWSPHGRVVFAGSDIANGWHGFMDGVIESGMSAARSVSQLL